MWYYFVIACTNGQQLEIKQGEDPDPGSHADDGKLPLELG